MLQPSSEVAVPTDSKHWNTQSPGWFKSKKKRIMDKIEVRDREMTTEELESLDRGFDENTIDNGVEIQNSEWFGAIATCEMDLLVVLQVYLIKMESPFQGGSI